jgi:4-cresol dehydrogenase (hydroxylating)
VEPGVTQAQLYAFLNERASKLWMDATGASPECSIIGNTVERGFGHTPYSDHFGHACGLEIVLANGEVIDTGFERFPQARTGPLYRWGVGPSIDGLFSQSNLGIVTRMSVWLMPAPECAEAFFFRSDDDGGLHALIEALRPLRLDGTLRSAVHIGNDYKVLAGIQQYPWDEAGGRTPLAPDVVRSLRGKLKFGAWNGSGALYGTARQIAEARRMVRAALRGQVARLEFLDARKLRLAQRFAKPYGMLTGWDLSRTLELVKPVFGLMQGVPTAQPLKSCYWRKRGPVPEDMDPDRDRCGLLWIAPILPLRGDDAVRGSDIAIRTLLEYGFEPAISLTLLTERTIDSVISISYDRDVPGEDERARQCHDELLRRLTAAGYYPYRLGIQSMGLMREPNSYNRFLDQIRDAVDPNRILAPGRYE